jgi:hypothetical protein
MEEKNKKEEVRKETLGDKDRKPMSRNKKLTIILSVLLVVLIGVGVTLLGFSMDWWGNKETRKFVEDIEHTDGFFTELGTSADQEQTGPVSPISGVACKTWDRRPFAVMLASDAVTRDNSAGFSDADLVFEVKASSSGLPRLMAVFVCGSPADIGSIRSAREQFVPIAQSLDAILVHWGGEHDVLDKLQSGTLIDDLDALGRGAAAFYRKDNIPKPHNGFTTTDKVMAQAQKLNFRLTSNLEPFAHKSSEPKENRPASGKLFLPYGGVSNVEYSYDSEKNNYKRVWGGNPHMDTNNGHQVAPSVIVVMRAKSSAWYSQYNKVEIEGKTGAITVYQNGKVEEGTWKHNAGGKLEFFDKNGGVMKFVPGQIWLNVLDPEDQVRWE